MNSPSPGKRAARSSPIATAGFPGRRCATARTALDVNWIGVTISDAKGKATYDGAFVTSLEVSRENVAEIAACARARWKIENESFNILKNNGYHLEHNFGHGKQNLAMLFAAMNLLAFAMHTVCDCLEDLWGEAREAKRARKRFFEHIRTTHRLSRLSRLANPHDDPHKLQTAPRNRKTDRSADARSGGDLELLPQRIIYVLAPEANRLGVPRLELKVMTTRLLKDGGLSQSAHNFEPRTALKSSSPAKYLRPSDFRIFRKIMMTRDAGGYYSSAPPFMSDDGFDLLQDILATNRARWLEVTGLALSPGPPREGKISWDAAKGDELQLRLDVGDGLLAMNATPPVYADPKTGLIGKIELGLSPKLARTLVAAPPAPITHAALLSEKMAQRSPEIAALRPPPPSPPVLWTKPPQIVLKLIRGELPIEGGQDYRYRYFGYSEPTEPVGLARLAFRYGPVDVEHGEQKPVILRYHDGALIEIQRDARTENAALKLFKAAGFAPAQKIRRHTPARHAHDFLPVDDDDFAWFDALYHELPRLKDEGWIIEIAPDFPVAPARRGGRHRRLHSRRFRHGLAGARSRRGRRRRNHRPRAAHRRADRRRRVRPDRLREPR